MLIYLCCFLLSFLLIYFSSKFKSKKANIILEILALSLLSYLAAIRDYSIGTDLQTYLLPIFKGILSKTFWTTSFFSSSIEKGFLFFVYIFAFISDNISVCLFFIQFFILFFVYYGIKRLYIDKYPFVFLMFLFLCYCILNK